MNGRAFHTTVAESLAENWWKKFCFEVPLNTDAVMESLGLDYTLSRELSRDVSGIYVATIDLDPFIIGNYYEPVTRQRFTAMHEVGHHLDHLNRLKRGIVHPDIRCDTSDWKHSQNPVEVKCDKIAAALLMPYWIVKTMHWELRHNTEKRLEVMADRFEVSITAMRKRLVELGLENRIRGRRLKSE